MAKKSNDKITVKIVGCILDILLIIVSLLIALSVYYIIQVKVQQKEYANLFGHTFFGVATGSMADTIQIGDVVIVKLTKDVEENDIIVYKDGENFITHRLIEKNENNLITKGDANSSEDKPIELEQVLGKIIFVIPKLEIWRKIILSPEVVGLIFAFLTLLGIAFRFTFKKEDRTGDKDNE